MEATTFLDDVRAVLVRDVEALQREVQMCPDDATLWEARPGIANPVGNLALHVAGNIRHFIGMTLGNIPYARDRDAEFSRRGLSRLEVATELAAALAVIHDVLPRIPAEQLDAAWEPAPLPTPVTTRRFLMHLCTHASFHAGQAGYLRRIVTGDSRSSGAGTSARIA
jgi:uncharacterized damage-inducible protein DinB